MADVSASSYPVVVKSFFGTQVDIVEVVTKNEHAYSFLWGVPTASSAYSNIVRVFWQLF
jgi:hypothetical protein